MIYDVFISYSARDSESALKLRSALEAEQGLRCFLAPKGVRAGQDFADEIRLALLSSRVVCLLATPSSLGSEWVTTEWGAAWVLKKPVIPVLLRRAVDDLPDRLRRVQAVDFHDASLVAAAIRDIPATPSQSEVELSVLPYASAEFIKRHRSYLENRPSVLYLLSYTGETTDGILLGFQDMALDVEVRLLVRDWTRERSDETLWNDTHPDKPRLWAKARTIEEAARSLPEKPWSCGSGGRVRLKQRFYVDPPFAKAVLYLKDQGPYAGFFGFYRYDPSMELRHPSIYVDVEQPILQTEHQPLLHMLKNEFDRRWQAARTIQETQRESTKAAEQRHAADGASRRS